jgi:hypothetical protein
MTLVVVGDFRESSKGGQRVLWLMKPCWSGVMVAFGLAVDRW